MNNTYTYYIYEVLPQKNTHDGQTWIDGVPGHTYHWCCEGTVQKYDWRSVDNAFGHMELVSDITRFNTDEFLFTVNFEITGV